MDEPFAALDALTRERLQDELLRLWGATGMTVLFVTHSVEEAAYLGTRVVTLSARPGRVVADRQLPRTRAATSGTAGTGETGLQRDDPRLVLERETLRRLVHDAAS
jgi:ABC-type nitrate/sulfonate/bicarbonate transport system ATPase subunit